MCISKRIILLFCIIGIILLGALGFATFLLLKQPDTSASAGSVTPTPTSLTATPHSTLNRACATGVISSIDSQNSTFVVKEAKRAKTITITADSQTTYHKRGAPGVSFSSLSVGQRVRVISQSACDPTAVSFTAESITIFVSNAPVSTPTTAPTPTP
jgi:hypothetical protein